jgi:hypothetical protein
MPATKSPEVVWVRGETPWATIVVISQLALFFIPAATAWTSSMTATVLIPLIALPVTMLAGAVAVLFREWRRTGVRIIVGTFLAAALEFALTIILVWAYSSANPAWDLS